MKIIEIDDVIPRSYQDQVEAETTSSSMAWFFHEESARSTSMFKTAFSGFSHMAYHIKEATPVMSPLSSILLPILFMFCDKANIKFNTLLRMRVGLFTRTMIEAVHHNPHVDFYEPTTAVNRERIRRKISVGPDLRRSDLEHRRSTRENKFTIAGRVHRRRARWRLRRRHYHAACIHEGRSRIAAPSFSSRQILRNVMERGCLALRGKAADGTCVNGFRGAPHVVQVGEWCQGTAAP